MKKFLIILFLLSGVAVGLADDIDDKPTAEEIANWRVDDAAIEASYAVGRD